MLLSRSGEYALRALIYIAEHGADAPVRTSAIAEALDMPRNYLSKLLHQLVGGGVLVSERGPRGGFRLAAAPQTLTLADALSPIEMDRIERRCLLGRSECDDANACPVHERWQELANDINTFLLRTTLADLKTERRRARARKPRG